MGDREQFQNAFSGFVLSQDILKEVKTMKKLSEVTELTGLTQSQIGLYIKTNLIHPSEEAAKHFESGVLMEGETEQLKAVQCLRIHDFGLEEIKYLSIAGAAASDFLQSKSEKKLTLYTNDPDILAAVATLQQYKPEGKELAKLQKELRHYDFIPKDPNYKPSWFEKHLAPIALAVILLILLSAIFVRLYALAAKVLFVLSMFLVGGVISLGGSIVYLIRRKPSRKYTNRGNATIRKVTAETGFDASFAMGKSVVPGYGFREQGQGGIWQIVFMFWNEIRPDHYFPLLSYYHHGTERIATLRYGGFKRTWKKGEQMTVYWSDDDNGIVYPEQASYMMKKCILYFLCASLLIGIFCIEVGPVTKALNSEFYVQDLKSILFGLGEDVYEGTETISDTEIKLEFTNFTGSRQISLNAKKGDVVIIQMDVEDYFHHFNYHLSNGIGGISKCLSSGVSDHIYDASFPIGKDATCYLNINAYQAAGTLHVTIRHGEEYAVAAGNALENMTASDTLALETRYSTGQEGAPETSTTFYYDRGRYYQRMEIVGENETLIQENLFDGERGWSRTIEPDTQETTAWSENPELCPEPEQFAELHTCADKLINQSNRYTGFAYLNGEFFCNTTDEGDEAELSEMLQHLEAEYAAASNEQKETIQAEIEHYQNIRDITGSIDILFDEADDKLLSYQSTLGISFEENQGIKSIEDILYSLKVLEDCEPATQIETLIQELP